MVDKETEVEVGERERDQPGGCGGRMSDSVRHGEREKRYCDNSVLQTRYVWGREREKGFRVGGICYMHFH